MQECRVELPELVWGRSLQIRCRWGHRQSFGRQTIDPMQRGIQLCDAAEEMRFDFHDGWVFAKIAGFFKMPEIGAQLCDGVSVGKIAHLLRW